MFPITYQQLWEMYNKAEASFWTAEEVDLSQDVQQWEALTDSKKHFISPGIFEAKVRPRLLDLVLYLPLL
ncbi:hypothetical protein ABKV19_005559 [Rosa sericea]